MTYLATGLACFVSAVTDMSSHKRASQKPRHGTPGIKTQRLTVTNCIF